VRTSILPALFCLAAVGVGQVCLVNLAAAQQIAPSTPISSPVLVSGTSSPSPTFSPNDAVSNREMTSVASSPVWEWTRNGLTIVNLLLVWLIFTRTRNQQLFERNEDRQYRKEERAETKTERLEQFRIDVGNFWIQRLILEPNRQLIEDFFDKYEGELRRVSESTSATASAPADELIAEAKRAVREFKTDYYRFKRRVVDPLCWVSHEFDTLKEVSHQIEDFVSMELAAIPGALHGHSGADQREPPAARLASLRGVIVRTILEANQRFSGVKVVPTPI
jgi:hypothetical protein